MNYKFFTCDVFTRKRFGGNQLAVIPQAEGLTTRRMQQIAREFNFSETTFVLPAEKGHTRKVRIFTPAREIPFAGHPNIGTAFVLAGSPENEDIHAGMTVVFEERAGLVPVTIDKKAGGRLWCELEAPERLSLGEIVMPEVAAAALSLETEEIELNVHPPRSAGVGFPFLIVELRSMEALKKARFNTLAMEQLAEEGVPPDVLLYVRSSGKVDIRARMFAPFEGVPEDPATGSANCALAALLSHYDPKKNGKFRWRIAQGIEMGRPSMLVARTEKKDGEIVATRIGGDCVMVSEGTITVD